MQHRHVHACSDSVANAVADAVSHTFFHAEVLMTLNAL
jgi:hypothetical protein